MSTDVVEGPTFAEQLESLPELKPFPASATQIMAACKDPNCSSKKVSQIITCDPGLAAKLLKVANSSMYGFSGKVRTVDHAVVLLGFRTVRDLALSMAGAEVFSQGAVAAAERKQLWNHSLATSTIARLLAKKLDGVVPEEAFLAGIFHDVGKLVFLDLAAERYVEMGQSTGDTLLIEAEQARFGIDHQELGLECSDDWGLPVEIGDAIGFHHIPQDANDGRTLAATVHVANVLAKLWFVDSSEVDAVERDERLHLALETSGLGVSEATIEELRESATLEYEDVKQACA